jgi:hypothetical protein
MTATADQLPVPDPAAVTGRGLAVFGLPPGGRRAAPGWQGRCISDPAGLARLWRPGDNIGVGCRASGVAGLDLDRHDGGPDGIATFAALCADRGQDWPATLTVRTPHGLHLYFRVPPGQIIPSVTGIWPGVDTRGPGRRSGGYLIGPGSIVGGQPYLIEHDTAIAALPAWLGSLLALRGFEQATERPVALVRRVRAELPPSTVRMRVGSWPGPSHDPPGPNGPKKTSTGSRRLFSAPASRKRTILRRRRTGRWAGPSRVQNASRNLPEALDVLRRILRH